LQGKVGNFLMELHGHILSKDDGSKAADGSGRESAASLDYCRGNLKVSLQRKNRLWIKAAALLAAAAFVFTLPRLSISRPGGQAGRERA